MPIVNDNIDWDVGDDQIFGGTNINFLSVVEENESCGQSGNW